MILTVRRQKEIGMSLSQVFLAQKYKLLSGQLIRISRTDAESSGQKIKKLILVPERSKIFQSNSESKVHLGNRYFTSHYLFTGMGKVA